LNATKTTSLKKNTEHTSDFEFTEAYAKQADKNDLLKVFRKKFEFPVINNKKALYFTGNSLGLKPKAADKAMQTELDDWGKWGVEGHFHGTNPWFAYHELFSKNLAQLTGAKKHEVVAMNGLTTNLHLLFASFYRPTKVRFKIICEKKAFPSDQYVLESQLKFHGIDPKTALIEVAPRKGEHTIRHQDIIEAINTHGDQLALVFIGGVNYYSGQVFNMEAITKAAHRAGAIAGFDLAHGFGNIELKLHDWQVDFAAWCSYKYLNSGPGSVAGVFIHETHGLNPETPRLSGWWGYDKTKRFLMESGFQPIPGAEGWQLSNAPILAMAVHRVALEIHCEAGMPALRKKSLKLTAYLEYLLQQISNQGRGVTFEVITPENPDGRGAQLSILVHGKGKELFDKITSQGVIADWREPNVIRVAPVPLYNSFRDVYQLAKILEKNI
jgi:kynureninase